ncbi:threonine ammonia-lyase [Fulvivirga lutimaris]|uniref:threonine ammonia-lyase n=1 Tax=Fulvivirga lutimaris TaxID=1819566 RepID=UPI0012BB599F|nr:pyridoxal-phosphate dependent enzyme [Fulvivirga lutimaris]MTI41976.1 pyridoxal-phosphate dependent enzyme [Fulvivirga lutimaris]
MSNLPTLEALNEAHTRVKPHVHRTPILTSESINEIAGCDIYFKSENFQKVGAFKARGGVNAILSLDEETLKKGVATHSSGNHAQAVALAAKIAGAKAYIVMPNNAPLVKKNAVIGYGAEVIECDPTLDAREITLNEVIEKTGAEMIHPYNDIRIIIGQGTAAKELIEDTEVNLEYILTPIGGGGLISGTLTAAHYLSPNTKVIGCEPEAADDAYRSFKSGTLQKNPAPPKTIADGLLTNLGELNFSIIKDHIHDILTVNDDEIRHAMKLIWERMKIIIEPSCAVPFAVILKNKEVFKGKKVGVILSGGNVDFDKVKF